jgi:hypothetical protein
MPEEPKVPDPQAESAAPAPTGEAETPNSAEKDEIGEFITRQVLDKDTVFFEG